ncbi:hypothetical protein Ancab_007297 [Ancistrocladus abbreviatus]
MDLLLKRRPLWLVTEVVDHFQTLLPDCSGLRYKLSGAGVWSFRWTSYICVNGVSRWARFSAQSGLQCSCPFLYQGFWAPDGLRAASGPDCGVPVTFARHEGGAIESSGLVFDVTGLRSTSIS